MVHLYQVLILDREDFFLPYDYTYIFHTLTSLFIYSTILSAPQKCDFIVHEHISSISYYHLARIFINIKANVSMFWFLAC